MVAYHVRVIYDVYGLYAVYNVYDVCDVDLCIDADKVHSVYDGVAI